MVKSKIITVGMIRIPCEHLTNAASSPPPSVLNGVCLVTDTSRQIEGKNYIREPYSNATRDISNTHILKFVKFLCNHEWLQTISNQKHS